MGNFHHFLMLHHISSFLFLVMNNIHFVAMEKIFQYILQMMKNFSSHPNFPEIHMFLLILRLHSLLDIKEKRSTSNQSYYTFLFKIIEVKFCVCVIILFFM